MFAAFPPERENVRGARWNPPRTPAIYTSLSRDTVISEADYYIGLQPIRPSARRIIYRIEVALNSVLDLSDLPILFKIGLISSFRIILTEPRDLIFKKGINLEPDEPPPPTSGFFLLSCFPAFLLS